MKPSEKQQLKVFNGFSLDLASDLSGLTKREITSLREHCVVRPPSTKQGYSFSFPDLLLFRVIKQLRVNDVTLKNIRQANDYLSHIDPTKNLNRYMLHVRLDTREIVYFGDNPENKDALINASKYGQLLLTGMLIVMPVGRQLEQVRQTVLNFDRDLDRSMRSKKVIPLDTVLARHGLL